MMTKESPLDAWLSSALAQPQADDGVWDPGFDGESRVVLAKLGPFYRLFEYPPKFFPRFYHQVFPLPIAEWQIAVATTLYGGLCTIDARLTIHFQATFNYAVKNPDALGQINAHVKSSYEGVVMTAVDAELRKLRDAGWIEAGLGDTERRIEQLLNETLIVKHIKCRAVCSLVPTFADLDQFASGLDGRFIQEAAYLAILQKHFQFKEKQALEHARQEQALELERMEHEFKLHELQQHKLFAQKQHSSDQFSIEAKLHEEKINHAKRLQSIEQAAELQHQLEQQARQQEIERQLHAKKLAHEAMLREKSLEAERVAQEIQLQRQQKLEEQLEAERIEHQSRLKEMQLQAEIKELELRVEVTKNKDAYLHRQIEWLVLDKQRAELSRAIKEAEHDIEAANRAAQQAQLPPP